MDPQPIGHILLTAHPSPKTPRHKAGINNNNNTTILTMIMISITTITNNMRIIITTTTVNATKISSDVQQKSKVANRRHI